MREKIKHIPNLEVPGPKIKWGQKSQTIIISNNLSWWLIDPLLKEWTNTHVNQLLFPQYMWPFKKPLRLNTVQSLTQYCTMGEKSCRNNFQHCTMGKKSCRNYFQAQRAQLKNNFNISQPKHMLWVLKRTISMRWFFWAPKIYAKNYG